MVEEAKVWLVTVKGRDKGEVKDRIELMFNFLNRYNMVTVKELHADVGGSFRLGRV